MRRLSAASSTIAVAFALMVMALATGCTASGPAPTVTPTTTAVTTTASSASASTSPTFSPPDVTPACPKWDTAKKETKDAPSTQDAISLVDTVAKNPCYDSVTFTINGQQASATNPVWYSADWVPALVADPKGDTIPVNGGAILQVVIHAPALGYDNAGHRPGKLLADVGGKVGQNVGRVVNEVRFAGSSEGQSNFGLGLDHKRPFNVTASSASGYTTVTVTVSIG